MPAQIPMELKSHAVDGDPARPHACDELVDLLVSAE
eukprot:CAMPEP_0181205312 /NCGR_PEP_ID=MMETSP1096-20121128/20407_1 /TAXON_ID=156174 ORGANISM="Chrysochromulina ericina, Strain CCMP281" /NCGR_SAMPLE_ID=MMETSP1096 /ASSEMBLY_ACC=CAM_ASM_000453 /LENGTH=35 /DNA_ID= /DNA_START= /DNA_END= /DNA_ORIENTATION=